MASTTTNIGLTLPASNENVSRQVINGNWTLIDTEFGKRKEIKSASFNVSIPAVAQNASDGRVFRAETYIDETITVIGYNIVVAREDMDTVKNAPYTITVAMLHGPGVVPDTHDYMCVDIVKNTTATANTPAVTITVRYYYFENSTPLSP